MSAGSDSYQARTSAAVSARCFRLKNADTASSLNSDKTRILKTTCLIQGVHGFGESLASSERARLICLPSSFRRHRNSAALDCNSNTDMAPESDAWAH